MDVRARRRQKGFPGCAAFCVAAPQQEKHELQRSKSECLCVTTLAGIAPADPIAFGRQTHHSTGVRLEEILQQVRTAVESVVPWDMVHEQQLFVHTHRRRVTT